MTKDEFVRVLVVALIDNGSFDMTGREFLALAKLAADEVDKLRPFTVHRNGTDGDEFILY